MRTTPRTLLLLIASALASCRADGIAFEPTLLTSGGLVCGLRTGAAALNGAVCLGPGHDERVDVRAALTALVRGVPTLLPTVGPSERAYFLDQSPGCVAGSTRADAPVTRILSLDPATDAAPVIEGEFPAIRCIDATKDRLVTTPSGRVLGLLLRASTYLSAAELGRADLAIDTASPLPAGVGTVLTTMAGSKPSLGQVVSDESSFDAWFVTVSGQQRWRLTRDGATALETCAGAGPFERPVASEEGVVRHFFAHGADGGLQAVSAACGAAKEAMQATGASISWTGTRLALFQPVADALIAWIGVARDDGSVDLRPVVFDRQIALLTSI